MTREPDRAPYRHLTLLILTITFAALGIGGLAFHDLETRLPATTGGSLAVLADKIADKLDQTLFERYADVHVAAFALAPHARDSERATH